MCVECGYSPIEVHLAKYAVESARWTLKARSFEITSRLWQAHAPRRFGWDQQGAAARRGGGARAVQAACDCTPAPALSLLTSVPLSDCYPVSVRLSRCHLMGRTGTAVYAAPCQAASQSVSSLSRAGRGSSQSIRHVPCSAPSCAFNVQIHAAACLPKGRAAQGHRNSTAAAALHAVLLQY